MIQGGLKKKLKFTLENGYTLSGIIDLYNEELQQVGDYKTCTLFKVMFKDYDDWKKQGLTYGWLLRKFNLPCKKAVFYAIMKDWTKGKTFKPNYPKLPIAVIEFNFTDDDFDMIDKFIYNKMEELRKAEELPDEELPECTPEEMWRADKICGNLI